MPPRARIPRIFQPATVTNRASLRKRGREAGCTSKVRAARIRWLLVLLCVSSGAGVSSSTVVAQQSAPPSASPAASLRSSAGNLLDQQIDTLLAAPAAAHAHWGISVVDAATGAPLYGRDDAQLFEPASNAKLFTTAAALALLGPGYAFRTTVVAEGELSADGHLHGNLRLVGSGDPTISGRSYPYTGHTAKPDPPLHGLDELAAQVAASGIHGVDGQVVGDDTLFPFERYGGGWGWDDLQWEYGAPVSALTVGDNVHYLKLTPGAHPGDPVTAAWDPVPSAAPDAPPASEQAIRQASDGIALAVSATTSPAGSSPKIGISQDFQSDSGSVRIYGTLPAGSKPMGVALAVPDAAQFAASAFTEALRGHGVPVRESGSAAHRQPVDTQSFAVETRQPVVLLPAPPPGAAGQAPVSPMPVSPSQISSSREANSQEVPGSPALRVVASRLSPPLAQIVTVTNKVSQNLHAELLLHTLGRVDGEDGSTAQGVRVVRQFLLSAGVDPLDFSFVDGSGLSPQDLVTPRAATTLLVYASRQSWGAVYRASLPLGGVDGSLAGRFATPPLRGQISAKTGTLSEVNALSGYLTAASGRQLVFSVLCNDYAGEGARATLDRVVTAIAGAF